MSVSGGTTDGEPVVRVVRGTPTAEEVAALVGALLTRVRPADEVPAAPPSAWIRSGRPGAGPPARPGAGAWRRSALPR